MDFDLQTVETMSPQDIYEGNKNGAIVLDAINAGVPISKYLEALDPSERYMSAENGYKRPTLDAFGRQLALNGIVVRSDPANGIYTSTWEKFLKTNRGLAMEFVFRKVREAQFGVRTPDVKLDAYTSADDPMGSIFRTFVDAQGYRAPRKSNALTLDRLVSVTTAIDGDAYRAAFMEEPDDSELHQSRVPEFGNFPTVKISQGQHTVRIHKYGIAYLMSYEAMRRANLDKLEFWINRSMLQLEADKVAHALDVLINGDGNSNGASTDDLTVLDSTATPPEITLKAWLAFKEQFGDNYAMDLAIMRKDVKLDLLMLDTGTGNTLIADSTVPLGGINTENDRLADVVDIVSLSTAPASTIIGIDTSVGLEHVVETGADLTEQVRFVENQSEKIVISEVEGFAVLDKQGARVLDLTS
jgi:hypothetical protein